MAKSDDRAWRTRNAVISQAEFLQPFEPIEPGRHGGRPDALTTTLRPSASAMPLTEPMLGPTLLTSRKRALWPTPHSRLFDFEASAGKSLRAHLPRRRLRVAAAWTSTGYDRRGSESV